MPLRKPSPTAASTGRRAGSRRALPPLSDSLVALRSAFLTVVALDTPGSDLPRYTEVLDDLLAWSTAQGDRFAARAEPSTAGVIAFAPAGGTGGPRWSLRPVRGGAPVLELVPAPGALQDAQRAEVRALFNAHSRTELGEDARLRIGFGALKNPTAREALLALLDTLRAEPPAGTAAGTHRSGATTDSSSS